MPSAVPDPFALLAQARVAIVGDVMLDRYWFGRVDRISPEAPVPVVQVEREEERPGGAANVALNIRALGARGILRAPVGADMPATRLGELLRDAGVEADFLEVPGLPTTVKLRVIGHQQQLLRLDFEAKPEEIPAGELLGQDGQWLSACGALVLSDYGKGAVREAQEWIRFCRGREIPVLVDPKGRDYGRYRGATLITPNKGEFQTVAGPWRDEEEFRQMGAYWRSRLELEALLVTRGEEGMTLFTATAIHHHPARAREVFDVTGAGDTVIATVAAGLAAGWPMDLAVELSNHAAGIVVGRLGAATVTLEELSAAFAAGESF